jgi:alkyl hydroperoxide reductase subunit AhpC
MFRKSVAVAAVVLGLALLSPKSWGMYSLAGSPAPPFVVESGDNRTLTRDMVLGKVVVLFYESRQVIEKNDELKEELKSLYRRQPEGVKKEIFRLVVIDCSEASPPTQFIWKSKLSSHSRQQGFTIYGDWTRKMLRDYRMQGNDSNFLIIDKHGIIRYSASGQVGNGQFQVIKNLLASLVQEG